MRKTATRMGIGIGIGKLLPFLFIVVDLASGAQAQAQPPDADVDRSWCRRAGAYALFNETIDKCVLGYNIRCKESYPDAPSPSEVQCGSGDGGICEERFCRCPPDTYAHFLGPMPGSYGRYTDYTCKPLRSVGESCQDNSLSCADDLWCAGVDNGSDSDSDPDVHVCACDGDWRETEGVCYNNRHCLRAFGEATFYDVVAKQCKCELGKPCNGSGSDDLCPGNSTLKGIICVCNEGFKSVSHGQRCVEAKGPGENCDLLDWTSLSQSDCAQGTGCIDGVCQCPADLGFRWDTKLEHCVVQAGKECDIGQDRIKGDRICTPHTICLWRIEPEESVFYFCECLDGLQEYANGECGLPHGAHCSRDEFFGCVEGMACLDERCVCKGSSCDRDNSTTCVGSATCDPTSRKCVCDIAAGFIPSANKARCFEALSYGANCTANQCDPSKGLACDEESEKCICLDSDLVYSEAEQACLAPIGSQCGEFEIEGSCLPTPTRHGQGGSGLSKHTPSCEYKVIKCLSGTSCTEDTGTCQAMGPDLGVIKSAPTQDGDPFL